MRKSFDGLVGVVRSLIVQDPLSGHLFVFFNKRRTMMKSIYWDRSGYCMVAKRPVRGTFFLPPANEHGVVELEASELALVLDAAARRARALEGRWWDPAHEPLGRAWTYLHNHWDILCVVVQDGALGRESWARLVGPVQGL